MKKTVTRKPIALILITLLAALMFNCSGGGGLSSSGNTSAVTIAISGLRKAARSAASVPGSVARVKIVISAPDMQAIERTVEISGRDNVIESFDVPNGNSRHFLAMAIGSDGSSSLYQGDVLSDLDGTPKNIDILMAFDISGQWTISSLDPNGNTGPATFLTLTQTGNSLTLSGTISDGGSFVGSGTIIGNNYRSSATGSACGNAFSRDVTGTVSADGRSMSGNFTLAGGCSGDLNTGAWSAAKTTTAPATCTYTYSDWSACQTDGTQSRTVISSSPAGCTGSPLLTQQCTYVPPPPTPTACAYTYSDWSACQADSTQSRTVISSSPAECTGTPVLTQGCSYVPPTLPSGFPSDIPTGNYNVIIQVCFSGTCYSGTTFTAVNTDINQFAQSLLDALNAAVQSQNNGCDSTAGCTCTSPVISYAPWDGASFSITVNISETCGGQTTSVSVVFTVSKM
jgi:hypothetical protein